MELIMLEKIDKKGLLHSLERKKRQEQQERENSCNVVVYDPKPQETQEVVDSIISEKLEALKKEKIEKEKGEAIEREKLMNALTFTDVPATIKKAGFHRDGSPKVAIAGLFNKKVSFSVWSKRAQYHSDSLEVVLTDIKTDWKNLILFFVGLAGVIASLLISMMAIRPSEALGFYTSIVLIIVGIFMPPMFLLSLVFVNGSREYGNYFTYILSDIGKVRTMPSLYADVPLVPESVLSKISGHGPFAILFEVTERWRKAEPDPVILRVINIDDQQFFEPVVGYDMTPLEKSSLVEA